MQSQRSGDRPRALRHEHTRPAVPSAQPTAGTRRGWAAARRSPRLTALPELRPISTPEAAGAGIVDQVSPGWGSPSPKCPRASLESSKPSTRPQLLPTTGDGAAWGGGNSAGVTWDRGKKRQTHSPRLDAHTPCGLLPRFPTGCRKIPRETKRSASYRPEAQRLSVPDAVFYPPPTSTR